MDETSPGTRALSKDGILEKVIEILRDMTSDWDLDFEDDISETTLIVADLEFESIDVVQFVVQLEEVFKRKDLPFEKLLMVDGRYRDDMRVEEIADFLNAHL